MKAIAIDFETANERRDSACAVGLAWVEDGVVTRREYALIRPPEMRFSPGNVRVHGLRPRDVADAPSFAEALGPFLDELSATLILAHNAAFDMGVLRAGLATAGLPAPAFEHLCTCATARRAWPDEPSHGLAAMARLADVRFAHHHAAEDAYACAAVALHALDALGLDRIGAMADALGLRRRSAPGWAPPPPRRAAAPPAPGRLRFTVRGRSGDAYEIAGGFEGAGYALRCSCRAGLFGRRCRHVTALLDGEVTDLLSDDHAVERLRGIVEALGMEAIGPPCRHSGAPKASPEPITADA